MSGSPEELEQRRAHRERLLKGRQANFEAMDKALITLSSGALGVSIAFIKEIVPLERAVWIWCLFASWGTFAVVLLAELASFWTSAKAHDSALEELDNAFSNRGSEPDYAACTENLNRAGIILFFVGVVLTIVFAIVNVLEIRKGADLMKQNTTVIQSQGSNSRPSSPEPFKKGIVPPKSPPPPPSPAPPQNTPPKK